MTAGQHLRDSSDTTPPTICADPSSSRTRPSANGWCAAAADGAGGQSRAPSTSYDSNHQTATTPGTCGGR